MKIIALYNIKGGVGKTATAVNLAYLAASEGYRVLLFDLDPQSAATFYFRIKPKLKKGIKKLISNAQVIDKRIKGTDYEGLDLLPSDTSMRKMDLLLYGAKKNTKILRSILEPMKNQYDLLFLDSPPNITLVSENIFYAADYILVPVIPTPLSLRTFEQINRFFMKKKIDTAKIIPFFSMVERRKKVHKQLMEEVFKKFPDFLKNYIPYRSEIEQMGIYRKPSVVKNKKSPTTIAYKSFWTEFYLRINKY